MDHYPESPSLTGGLAHSPLRYVDPLIGTAELGNTFPGVCRPFGLAKWTPQTVAEHMKPAFASSFVPVERTFDLINWDPI